MKFQSFKVPNLVSQERNELDLAMLVGMGVQILYKNEPKPLQTLMISKTGSIVSYITRHKFSSCCLFHVY